MRSLRLFLFALLSGLISVVGWTPAVAKQLTVTNHPTPPPDKTLSTATLKVVYSSVYQDGSSGGNYPTIFSAEWDKTNNGWKPTGTADGTAFWLPGPDTYDVSDLHVATPDITFTEVQAYSDGTSQTKKWTQTISASSLGEWSYATPSPTASYLSAATSTTVLTPTSFASGDLLSSNGSAIVGTKTPSITSLTLSTPLSVSSGGTGSPTASGARSNLGLAIGTDIPSLTGTGASGTWNISILGNAATATNGIVSTGSYADPAWLTSLDGAKVTGVIGASQVPSLDASKITTGTFSSALIPSLDASKITSGTLSTSVVPNLDASKITTGTLSTGVIPNLSAAKITSGTMAQARLFNFGPWTAFGDSITYGYSATGGGYPNNASQWTKLVASELGLTLTNQAHSGDMISNQDDKIFQTIVPDTGNQIYTLWLGHNDQRIEGVNTARKLIFRNAYEAAGDWLTVPDSQKHYPASCTEGNTGGGGGSWTNMSVYGGALGRVSYTQGDYIECSNVPGRTIIAWTMMQEGKPGAWALSVDGVVKATGTTNVAVGDIQGDVAHQVAGNVLTYEAGEIKVRGLGNTGHTVRLTVTSATDPANVVYALPMAGRNLHQFDGGPRLLAGLTLQEMTVPLNNGVSNPGSTTDCSGTGGGDPCTDGYKRNGGSGGNVGDYNREIESAISDIIQEGGNAKVWDAMSLMTNADLNPLDGIHPLDSGHRKIANVVEEALNPLPTTRERTAFSFQDVLTDIPAATVPRLTANGGGIEDSHVLSNSTYGLDISSAAIRLGANAEGSNSRSSLGAKIGRLTSLMYDTTTYPTDWTPFSIGVNATQNVAAIGRDTVRYAPTDFIVSVGADNHTLRGTDVLDATATSFKVMEPLDLWTANETLGADSVGATTRTDNHTKLARLTFPHYTNAQPNVMGIAEGSTSTDNTLVLGGGGSSGEATTTTHILQKSSATNTDTTGGTTIADLSIYGQKFSGATLDGSHSLLQLGNYPTSWDSGGTYLGVNTGSSFTGDLARFAVNNSDRFRLANNGYAYASGGYVLNPSSVASRDIQFQTNGSPRWILRTNNTAESGANAGSDWNLVRYNDSGVSQGNALSITRSTGNATFSGSVAWGGGTALSTSGSTGSGNIALATSPSLTTPSMSSPTISGNVSQSGAAGSNRQYIWQTAGSARWAARTESTAESGSNAGSNWRLDAYDDSGALIGAALNITRSNMAITTGGPLTLTGSSATDGPTMSAELLSSSGWTSTDWTGDFSTGWMHTTGNTTVLSNTLAAVNTAKYQISYTVTGRTAGTFTIAFGGQSNTGLTATGTWGPTATSTASLTVTPTSDFNGTIVLSIKRLTAVSTPLLALKSSDGTARLEARADTGGSNSFTGYQSGAYNTTGNYNAGLGYQALYYNTTGNYNAGLGMSALYSNTTGSFNTGLGYQALYYNTTGNYNAGLGWRALYNNTTGVQNAGLGAYALYSNTTGSSNIGLGLSALYSNTTGSYNAGLGYEAGRYIADGSTANQTSGTSTYLGANTKSLASGDSNETVVGYNAIGAGSNSVTLGNTSVTKTVLQGTVNLSGPALLKSYATGSLPAAPGTGALAYDSTTNQVKAYNGTIWGLSNGTTRQSVTGAAGLTLAFASGSTVQVNLGATNSVSALSGLVDGGIYRLLLVQDGTGSRTVSAWPAAIKWAGGTAPTLTATASSRDIITFVSDGTNLFETARSMDVR